MLKFPSLTLRRAAEDAYDVLHAGILAGDLAPGQRLDVGLISSQLGISRTPVKDALHRLSAEGLIEIHARKGTFVTKISPVDVRETFEVRAALEGLACELLAGRLTPSMAQKLAKLNGAMYAPNLTTVEHARLNNEFHRLIVENASNRRLLKLYSELNSHLQLARVYYGSKDWQHRGSIVAKEHQQIIEALTENRPVDAKRLMEAHIRGAMDRLISQILHGVAAGAPEEAAASASRSI